MSVQSGAGQRASTLPQSGANAPTSGADAGDVNARLERIEGLLDTLVSSLAAPRASTTYLTVPEAMAYLRFGNRNSLYDWLTKQRVPRCRRGRTILLRRVDLERAVAPASVEPEVRTRKAR